MITDSHVHLYEIEHIPALGRIADHLGAARMNIASIIDVHRVNFNPEAFVAKAMYPERFYVFAGLDHASHISSGTIATPSLVEQLDWLIKIGVDGIKLLETKPEQRKFVDIPLDGDYYDGFFARCQETETPILWHVGDPEEFWKPDKIPGWAKAQGWGYDDSFVPLAQLYAEVENVLARYPRLRIIFAHFYFISSDLTRAAKLLDTYPGVHLDLTPGIELIYNLSKNVPETRRFFTKYADRILYGTDIDAGAPLRQAEVRSEIVKRWLETGDEYRIPDGADPWLGPPTDGVMNGLSFPQDVVQMICRTNFENLVGSTPKPLDKKRAFLECGRLSVCQSDLTGKDLDETPAFLAAERLAPGNS